MFSCFPPRPSVGSRVWSFGYRDHGPVGGPKTDIPRDIGGAVEAISSNHPFSDLFSVRWDNGQCSKHYERELHCIGSFRTHAEFVAALNPEGDVELTLGPQGGFREARLRLRTGDHTINVHLSEDDGRWWRKYLEPMVKERGLPVQTTQLLPKPPAAKDPYDKFERTTLRVKLTAKLKEKLNACCQETGIAADKLVRQLIEEQLKGVKTKRADRAH